MIVETIRSVLIADVTVAGIVGQRVYAVDIPDAPLFPLLVIGKAGAIGEYDFGGDAGIERARIRVDCYSDAGQSQLLALKSAVRAALSGYSGGPATSQCSIDSVFVIQDTDLPGTSFQRAGPIRLRRRLLEFNVWHRGL